MNTFFQKGFVEKRASVNDAKHLALKLLATLRALAWSHQTSHWQVEGVTFYGDHLLFERLYNKAVAESDALAEKVVGLYGTSAVDPLEQQSCMALRLQDWSSEGDLFLRALKAEKDLQEEIAYDLEQMEGLQSLSLGMDDLLRTMANDHESHLYLLQQRLSKGGPRFAAQWPDVTQRVANRHLITKGQVTWK